MFDVVIGLKMAKHGYLAMRTQGFIMKGGGLESSILRNGNSSFDDKESHPTDKHSWIMAWFCSFI